MDIQLLVDSQRVYYHEGKTRQADLRILRLKALYYGILKYEKEIMNALKVDLNKSEFESYTTEIGILLKEITFTMKNLHKWMAHKVVKTPVTHFGSKSVIVPEPYGVTLIIAPWNYPFQLAISPLIGAIAAGNTAVIKPSELTPTVSGVLARLIEEIYPREFVAVIEGGVEVSEQLLEGKFDYIFFTGSVPVGKLVMAAAAKQLIPLTLELGGKSPTIVHCDANLRLAAKRIVWGKYMNAGQTCIAPDYVYVHHEVKEEFLRYVQEEITHMYGKNPLLNQDYPRLVSERHFRRMCSFLADGKVVIGGDVSEETLTIAPTVMNVVDWTTSVMQEEIFGPILPILAYHNLDNVIEEICKRPKPLALYLFTNSKKIEEEVITRVSYGGGCINDTIYHIVTPYLPFGGVGESGMGSYHGEHSFVAFSHYKGIVKQTRLFDIPLRYPAMKNGLELMKRVLK